MPCSLPSPLSLLKSPIVVIQKFCCHGNVTSHFSSPIETLSNATQLTELNSVLTISMWFEPWNPTIRMYVPGDCRIRRHCERFQEKKEEKKRKETEESTKRNQKLNDGVRALSSHQGGLGSNPGVDVIHALRLLITRSSLLREVNISSAFPFPRKKKNSKF